MSEIKEMLLKEYENRFGECCEKFEDYIKERLIEKSGIFVMNKEEYYKMCNEFNECNSAIRYTKRIKRFKKILSWLNYFKYEFNKSRKFVLNTNDIPYTAIKYNPTGMFMYFLKKFSEKYKDIEIQIDLKEFKIKFTIL